MAGEEGRKAVGGALHLPAAQLGVHPAPGRRERPGRRRCRRGGRGGWRGGGVEGQGEIIMIFFHWQDSGLCCTMQQDWPWSRSSGRLASIIAIQRVLFGCNPTGWFFKLPTQNLAKS